MCKVPTYRCACGHIAEWHYKVSAEGGHLVFRDPCHGDGFLPGKVRCPSYHCECTEITEPREIALEATA